MRKIFVSLIIVLLVFSFIPKVNAAMQVDIFIDLYNLPDTCEVRIVEFDENTDFEGLDDVFLHSILKEDLRNSDSKYFIQKIFNYTPVEFALVIADTEGELIMSNFVDYDHKKYFESYSYDFNTNILTKTATHEKEIINESDTFLIIFAIVLLLIPLIIWLVLLFTFRRKHITALKVSLWLVTFLILFIIVATIYLVLTSW
jgi:hypothetical protein